MIFRTSAFLFLISVISTWAQAADLYVAAAGNFTATLQRLVPLYEQQTGHDVKISYGSTGKLYAQILQGAPFDVFLSADQERPQRLVAEGHALADSLYTYAIGRLVLWSPQPERVDTQGNVLSRGGFRYLAIANPKTAPYGQAAWQVLQRLGLLETLRPRLVQGDNIAQTHQFVVSGNAELGFIAAAQWESMEGKRGSHWRVPETLHSPIRQAAVPLIRARNPEAARAFMHFLQSPNARALIAASGYDLAEPQESQP